MNTTPFLKKKKKNLFSFSKKILIALFSLKKICSMEYLPTIFASRTSRHSRTRCYQLQHACRTRGPVHMPTVAPRTNVAMINSAKTPGQSADSSYVCTNPCGRRTWRQPPVTKQAAFSIEQFLWRPNQLACTAQAHACMSLPCLPTV